MTCVVGLIEKDRIWMGADSAGVAGYDLTIRKDPKIFKVQNMLIGFTTSFRMGQLLGLSFKPPKHNPKIDTYKYMVTDFIDEVRRCLISGGYIEIKDHKETGGIFLVAYHGRLFKIDSDFQVGEEVKNFATCGCGEDFATGALYATVGMKPKTRILNALQIAEMGSAGVRGPFLIKNMRIE